MHLVRLASKEAELEGERAAMIKDWKNKATPLKDWLKKEETKCADYQQTPENYEEITAEINQLQVVQYSCDSYSYYAIHHIIFRILYHTLYHIIFRTIYHTMYHSMYHRINHGIHHDIYHIMIFYITLKMFTMSYTVRYSILYALPYHTISYFHLRILCQMQQHFYRIFQYFSFVTEYDLLWFLSRHLFFSRRFLRRLSKKKNNLT